MTQLTYFITGGNRGIGFQIVKQLSASKDNKIIASARDISKAVELKELAEKTGNISIVTLDVSSEESIAKLNAQLSRFAADGIDVFVSNAGIATKSVPLLEVSNELQKQVIATNTLGPVWITRVVKTYLLKKQTRKIIYVSSLAGSLGAFVEVPFNIYGASKAGLNYVTKELSFELKPEGFTVVAVHPGVVFTDMGNTAVEFFKESGLGAQFEPFLATALTPEQSAKAIHDNIIIGTTAESSGKFLNYDGEELPW